MKTIDERIDDVLLHEGGYVDDPDDPGGATNWGITHGTLAAWRGTKVTKQDVKDLTEEEACDIYKDRYYIKPKINQLPESLRSVIFDMYVNAGGGAIRILQRLLIKYEQRVSVDGALGPNSISAVKKIAAQYPGFISDAYSIERREFYYRIGDKRVKSRKYAKRRDGSKGGWIIRAESFMSPKYHYTDTQHQQRIGAWS